MAESASTKISLPHPVTVNGVTYPKGTIDVPSEIASDLMRIATTYQDHLTERHIRHDHQKSIGSMAVGGE